MSSSPASRKRSRHGPLDTVANQRQKLAASSEGGEAAKPTKVSAKTFAAPVHNNNENAPPQIVSGSRSTRSNSDNRNGIKQEEVTNTTEPLLAASSRTQRGIKREEEPPEQQPDQLISTRKTKKRFAVASRKKDLGRLVFIEFPKASHQAFIIIDLETKLDRISDDGLRVLIQWKETGKRDEVEVSRITRGMLSPVLDQDQAIKKRPSRKRNKPNYFALAGLNQDDDGHEIVAEKTSGAKSVVKTEQAGNSYSTGSRVPRRSTTRKDPQRKEAPPPPPTANADADAHALRESVAPEATKKDEKAPLAPTSTKATRETRTSKCEARQKQTNKAPPPSMPEGVKWASNVKPPADTTLPSGGKPAVEMQTVGTEPHPKPTSKFRYPHAQHMDLKVNRYMPAKPKPKRLREPSPPEIGNIVWFVDNKTFHSRCARLDDLHKQRCARVVGDSVFAHDSNHERLLQLHCEETNERWYVKESEVTRPYLLDR